MLSEPDFGLCIKNSEYEVLYQNEYSKKECGSRCGKVCNDGCMKLYHESPSQTLNLGTQFMKARPMHSGIFDVMLINDGKFLSTVFYNCEQNHDIALTEFKNFGLSDRELEILTFAIDGLSNMEICKRLFISKPTVKTHLNHIHKKLPGALNKFLIEKRKRS